MVQNAGGADAAALEAARRGDLAAFNHFVRRYQRQIYNLCFRMLGNAEDAADATQEAFLHAYRGLSGFRGPADGFVSWLVRIAANGCYDQLRRQQRRPSESLERLIQEPGEDGAPLQRVEPRDPSPGPDARAMSAETARRIQAGLDALSPHLRLTVVLCDVQGLRYEEAAAAMQVELGTVKSRLSRARVQLRAYLVAHGELPAAARRLERREGGTE